MRQFAVVFTTDHHLSLSSARRIRYMSQLISIRTSSSNQLPGLTRQFFLSGFSIKALYEFSLIPPRMPHSTTSLIFPQFGHLDNSTNQCISCCFPQLPVTGHDIRPYLPQHPRPMFSQCAGSQWDNEFLTDKISVFQQSFTKYVACVKCSDAAGLGCDTMSQINSEKNLHLDTGTL
jgi:hypothetical protein